MRIEQNIGATRKTGAATDGEVRLFASLVKERAAPNASSPQECD